MFKQLKGFLAQGPHADATDKGPKPGSKPGIATKDYRAVSVTPGIKCCHTAKSKVGESFLMRDAPRLPFPECTVPAECSCTFKKVSDRRNADGDRREIGISETGRWYAGQENRLRRSRRTGKG